MIDIHGTISNTVWDKFVSGDRVAFTAIYNDNIDALFSYGVKLYSNESFVKDCIQDVFLDVYDQRKSLTRPRNIQFYLFVVFKRILFRKLAKERRNASLSELDGVSFVMDYNNIEDKTIFEEEVFHKKKVISTLLKELTPKQQEILYLRFSKGFNYKEISKIIDIDHNSVRKQVYRAIKKLRKSDILQDECDAVVYLWVSAIIH